MSTWPPQHLKRSTDPNKYARSYHNLDIYFSKFHLLAVSPEATEYNHQLFKILPPRISETCGFQYCNVRSVCSQVSEESTDGPWC